MNYRRLAALAILALPLLSPCLQAESRVVEKLDRGLVALRQDDGKVWLSWRLFSADADASFRIYRRVGSAAATCVGESSGKAGTWFVDTKAPRDSALSYEVRAVLAGRELDASGSFMLASGGSSPYLRIPLQVPAGGTGDKGRPFTYEANDGSVGDLDGDGRLELILKWSPTNAQDNSRTGRTANTYIDAYTLDGQQLWRIDLGRNIRSGAHYTQFMVADYDGDGRAEMICKTADGSIDGRGKLIGDADADHRSESGHVVAGPEFLTVFDGRSGAALDTVAYVPTRHPSIQDPTGEQLKAVWGDGYGNRSERYLAAVAYLDGKLPSAVMCRGYYTRATLAAWDFRNGRLSLRWSFDSDDGKPGHKAYRGQGNHNMSVADVDGDGRDEIVYGSAVYDDNGEGLYSTGWGHADAMHVSDLVPSNPGLEVFNIQERFSGEGLNMRDARTGKPIFTIPSVKADTEGGDKGEGPGRGVAFNVDPRHPGSECWARGAGMSGMYSSTGARISEKSPRSCNFAVWWDGDYLRELLDGNRVSKWNWRDSSETVLLSAEGASSNNGTKSTPVISGDILGDWREEVVLRSTDNTELRIYTTTIPTRHRHVTLLEDSQYRLALAWQNTTYNQPPHPSYMLEEPAD